MFDLNNIGYEGGSLVIQLNSDKAICIIKKSTQYAITNWRAKKVDENQDSGCRFFFNNSTEFFTPSNAF